jgi:FkbM family methyltransferase
VTEYFVEERDLLQRVVRAGWGPSVIYDIGAASGHWSGIVGAELPPAEYHLFEPLASHGTYSKTLGDYLSCNPNWKLHEVALSDTNGTAAITVGEGDYIYGSTILDIGEIDGYGGTVEVPKWRLDDYVKSKGLPDPDFVKMDTQASEHLIIKGGLHTIARASGILIETWLYKSYGPQTPLLGEIIDLLTPMGFVLFEFGGDYRDSNGTKVSVDAVFTKPGLAQVLAEARSYQPKTSS